MASCEHTKKQRIFHNSQMSQFDYILIKLNQVSEFGSIYHFNIQTQADDHILLTKNTFAKTETFSKTDPNTKL